MSEVSMQAPQEVFRYFQEISDIPRCARHTKEISDYIVNFAKEHGLTYDQDDLNNVIIYADGTGGYEDADAVMLQGHIDMVAAKTEDSDHDFTKDPLELYVDGDLIRAKNTTLGADDGIAVAMMLAVLDGKDIPHPPLECVFTVDEEIGMLGAEGLDGSKLKTKKILNLDSEEEGILTVGCAGAVDLYAHIPTARETVSGTGYHYEVKGLLGGHSGSDIHMERAHAANLTARVLMEAGRKAAFRIVTLSGGEVTNAIMNKVVGELVVKKGEEQAFEQAVAEITETARAEYRTADPDMVFLTEKKGEVTEEALTEESQKTVLSYLNILPLGVQQTSLDLGGMPETSVSMGILRLEGKEFYSGSMARSMVNSRRDHLADQIQLMTELVGGTLERKGEYGAWEFNPNSRLLDICTEVYEKQYGEKPVSGAVHAGVECGKWAEKLGEIDAVSLGPDMRNVHTFNEYLSISSTARTWEYLKNVLKACR